MRSDAEISGLIASAEQVDSASAATNTQMGKSDVPSEIASHKRRETDTEYPNSGAKRSKKTAENAQFPKVPSRGNTMSKMVRSKMEEHQAEATMLRHWLSPIQHSAQCSDTPWASATHWTVWTRCSCGKWRALSAIRQHRQVSSSK